MKSRSSLLTRRFLPLFALFQLGTFNDNGLKNALIALITFGGVAFLSDLNSAIRVPVAALIFTGPFLLVCAIAGQIADKVDRGVIFRWIKRAEVAIMLLGAVGFLTTNVIILAVALGLMGAQSAFFSPTKNAVLPQWLSEHELIRGNALLSGFQFAVILFGIVGGTALVLMPNGPLILSVLLVVLAVLGWIASEFCPPAPAPSPELRVDYNPVTAIWKVVREIFDYPDVLRPWLGIAWFYGASTIFVTAFPDFIKTQMQFSSNILILFFGTTTAAVLLGSLTCALIGNWRVWGPEAVRLSTLGIIGVVLSSLLLYLVPHPVFAGEGLGEAADFLAHSDTPLFLGAVAGASYFNGLFVVPLQAMTQRRAEPEIRAQLMSAGAVLYNFGVNIVTFGLIGLAFLSMPPKLPFLMVVLGSAVVAAYSIYRSVKIVERPQPGVMT